MVDLKRNVARMYGRDIPKLYFENDETELAIANLYSDKKDIYRYFALVLLRLDFKSDDSILICNYDKENNSFDCIRNNKKDCRLYIDKDNSEIIVSRNNMEYGYKCVEQEHSELGMIIVLDRYIFNYKGGMSFLRYLSRDMAKFVVKYNDYRLEFEVDRPDDIQLGLFDENGKRSKYLLDNEGEIIEYLTEYAIDDDIVDIYKKLSFGYLSDVSRFPNLYLRKYYDDELIDLVHLKNGELEKFGITDFGMTIFLDKDNNWSYEVSKDDAVPVDFSITSCNGKVSCSFSFDEKDTDIKDYINGEFDSEIDSAMDEVKDVKKLVRTMFD